MALDLDLVRNLAPWLGGIVLGYLGSIAALPVDYWRSYWKKRGEQRAERKEHENTKKQIEAANAEANIPTDSQQMVSEKELSNLQNLSHWISMLKVATLGLRPEIDVENSNTDDERQRRLQFWVQTHKSLTDIFFGLTPFIPQEVAEKVESLRRLMALEARQYSRGAQGDEIQYWKQQEDNANNIRMLQNEMSEAIRARLKELSDAG